MRSDGTSYTNVVISVVGKWTPSKANTLRIVPEGLAFCNVGHVARIAILLASNETQCPVGKYVKSSHYVCGS